MRRYPKINNRSRTRRRTMMERYNLRNRGINGRMAYPYVFGLNEAVIFENIDFEAVAKKAIGMIPIDEPFELNEIKIDRGEDEVEVMFQVGLLPHYVGQMGYSVEFEPETESVVHIEVSFGVYMNGEMLTKEIAAFVYDMQTDTLEEDNRQ